jgi:hypothetical protein
VLDDGVRVNLEQHPVTPKQHNKRPRQRTAAGE